MTKKDVVIVGGGFAGLAAGVELASRGHQVTLFERRTHLGGRAYSFRDPSTGSTLDNGQHLLMGCYTATLKFLGKIGTRDKVRLQRNLSLSFVEPGGKRTRFNAWPLPNPFHLAAGLACFRGFSLEEKWKFLRMRKALKDREGLDEKSVTSWLKEWGQGERVRHRFWDLLALAALNDDPEHCSATTFQAVLREALFSGRKESRIGFSTVGLSELYADPAREFIENQGGHVILQSPVKRLCFSGEEFRELELEGGRKIAPEILILAVPFGALRQILPEEVLYQNPFFQRIRSLQSSPIVAINLWYDRDFVPTGPAPDDFVGLWGTRVHWLFKRRGYYSLVISGARKELLMPAADLIRMAENELLSLFPAAASAKRVYARVMKEPEATLSPAIGTQSLRLPQKTPFKGLYLAGDWTDTGLPATIEGAVRSANKVVDLIDPGR